MNIPETTPTQSLKTWLVEHPVQKGYTFFIDQVFATSENQEWFEIPSQYKKLVQEILATAPQNLSQIVRLVSEKRLLHQGIDAKKVYLELDQWPDRIYINYLDLLELIEKLAPCLSDALFFISELLEIEPMNEPMNGSMNRPMNGPINWIDEYRIKQGHVFVSRTWLPSSVLSERTLFYLAKAEQAVAEEKTAFFRFAARKALQQGKMEIESLWLGGDVKDGFRCVELGSGQEHHQTFSQEEIEKDLKISQESAEFFLTKSIEFDPTSAQAFYALACLRQYQHHVQEELQALEQAILLQPDFYEAWRNKGILLVQTEKYEEGIVCLSKAIQWYQTRSEEIDFRENGVNPWVFCGYALLKVGKYQEALVHLQKVYEENSKPDFSTLLNLASCFLSLHHFKQAIHFYTLVLESGKSQDPAKIYYNRACAYLLHGSIKAAYQDMKQALQLDPTLVDVLLQDPDWKNDVPYLNLV